MTAHARRTDPSTSHAAARSVGKVAELQERILGLFEHFGPMDDRELVRRFDTYASALATPQNIRSRRAELVQQGRVRDSGKRERGPSGRMFVVWERTEGLRGSGGCAKLRGVRVAKNHPG